MNSRCLRGTTLVVALALLATGVAGSMRLFTAGAQGRVCVPIGPEVVDNGVDEDCDGWLGTRHGYNVRSSHPRVLLAPEMLDATLARMTGPSAREPYRSWYELIKAREDQEQDVDLVNLALIYKATGDTAYLDRFQDRRATSGDPGLTEMYAVDILWDDLPDSIKLNLMQRVSANDDCLPDLALYGAPADRAIRLSWTVNTSLPVTSTWQLDYESDTGTLLIPPLSFAHTVRSHTLTGLTNGVWYTITLRSVVGSNAVLADSVRVMPTDQFFFLPLVLR